MAGRNHSHKTTSQKPYKILSALVHFLLNIVWKFHENQLFSSKYVIRIWGKYIDVLGLWQFSETVTPQFSTDKYYEGPA